MDAKEVLRSAIKNEYGISIPAPLQDVMYVLRFYTLNKAPIPGKYSQWFLNSYAHHAALCRLVKKKQALHPVTMQEGFNKEIHHNIRQEISKYPFNNGLLKIRHILAYYMDSVRSHLLRGGFIITFSGVDGAGKSTVISLLQQRLEKEIRKPVVVLRHRPSILPILSAWKYGRSGAEERSVSRLPRTGNNTAGLSSWMRFAYYYTDYLLGQFYVYARYVLRGYIVLYDRYYFDFINDSKRSNIVIKENIANWLYKLLLKPRLNFFLYAPAEVILQRKQELDPATITTLTERYLNLFAKLQKDDTANLYQPICNLQLDTTINNIFANIKNQQQ